MTIKERIKELEKELRMLKAQLPNKNFTADTFIKKFTEAFEVKDGLAISKNFEIAVDMDNGGYEVKKKVIIPNSYVQYEEHNNNEYKKILTLAPEHIAFAIKAMDLMPKKIDFLNGICFEMSDGKLYIKSTDTYALRMKEFDIEKTKYNSFIIYEDTMKIIKQLKGMDIDVYEGKNNTIMLDVKDIDLKLYMNQLDRRFPDFTLITNRLSFDESYKMPLLNKEIMNEAKLSENLICIYGNKLVTRVNEYPIDKDTKKDSVYNIKYLKAVLDLNQNMFISDNKMIYAKKDNEIIVAMPVNKNYEKYMKKD